MDINDMKIFITVANSNSVSKAAEYLGYVQSNVSKRIEKIERELGCKLFIRTNKGMKLLPQGEVFFNHCIKILEVMRDIEKDFLMTIKPIQIGATQSISKNYLYTLYTNSKYSLFIRTIAQLVEMLKQGYLDILIVNRELSGDGFRCDTTFSEKISWVKANKSRYSLGDKPIVVSRDEQCPYRAATIRYLEQHPTKKKNQLIEVDTIDMVLTMIENDQAHAIIPVKTIELSDTVTYLKSDELPEVLIYIYTNPSSKKVHDISNIKIELTNLIEYLS